MTVPGLPPLPDGLPEARDARPMAGGDIAAVWDVTLGDGRRVVVKTGGSDPGLEAGGLDALPAQLRDRLQRAMAHTLPALRGHDVRPSLVHGDL